MFSDNGYGLNLFINGILIKETSFQKALDDAIFSGLTLLFEELFVLQDSSVGQTRRRARLGTLGLNASSMTVRALNKRV